MLLGIVPECIYECESDGFTFKVEGAPNATNFCEGSEPRPPDPPACK
jgi:hypothetical protein